MRSMRSARSLFLDIALVAVATVMALMLRNDFAVSASEAVAVLPYLVLTLVFAAVILPALGVSRTVWRFTSMKDYLAIVMATAMIIVGALALTFVVNRLEGIARSLPILQGLLLVSLLVGIRIVTRIRHARRDRIAVPPMAHSAGRETILVVGFNKLAELYLQCVEQFAAGRVTIAGLLEPDARIGQSLRSHPVLGTPENIVGVMRDLEIHGVFVDRVIVATPFEALTPAAKDALLQLEANSGLAVDCLDRRMGLDPYLTGGATHASPDKGCSNDKEPVFSCPADNWLADDNVAALNRRASWRLKRMIDLFGAMALLVILAPVIALVSILVALDVGLPVMFWQQRPGLGGRPFRVYKFRTMGPAYDGCGRRRSDAERVSKLGSFLRRTRLDELPQLFSILVGHMSFVGPRPLLPVDQPAGHSARLLVRPGLTGWAQIKGGRAISARDKAALDVWYVNNFSFALDVRIVLGTIPIVLFGERVNECAIVQAWRELQGAGIGAADDFAEQPVYVLSRP